MLIFGNGLSDNRVVLFEMPPHLQQKQQLRASAIFHGVQLGPPLTIILLQRLSGPPPAARLIRGRRPAQRIHQSVLRTCDSPHLHRRLQAMRSMTSCFPCASKREEIEVITRLRAMFVNKHQLFHIQSPPYRPVDTMSSQPLVYPPQHLCYNYAAESAPSALRSDEVSAISVSTNCDEDAHRVLSTVTTASLGHVGATFLRS